MNRGYVHFWRKTLDSGWLRNHQLWAFWSWCLLKATHKEFTAIVGLQRVHLKPGQFVFGLKKAAEETGLSVQQVRTVLAFLENAGNLTIKTTNKFSIISIVNWDIYQGSEPQNNKQTNKPLTNDQQHTSTVTHKHNKRGATLAPEDFPITEPMRSYAKKKGYTGDLQTLSEKFLNYHRAKGSKFASWESAFKNWVLKEIEFHPAAATDQPLNGGRSLEDILS